ncbi:hypothetical protein ACI780_22920 [Geodermatophilus sp. SYSU D00814]
MTCRLLVPLAATACLVAAATPASAIPPDRVVDVTFDPAVVEKDPDLSPLCGFEVTSSAKGHFRLTIHLDRNGEFVRAVGHPSSSITLTGPGGTVTTADRGMDRTTVDPDGTLTVFGTGIHLKVEGGAHAIGLWVLVIDPETGELLSEEYHGRFDVVAPEIVGHLCEQLG